MHQNLAYRVEILTSESTKDTMNFVCFAIKYFSTENILQKNYSFRLGSELKISYVGSYQESDV
jgi:hypothetical protein